jgi:UDP-N-acetylmuramate dehydrogenase
LISLTEIKEFFKGKISLNESLSQFTTFRIGGEADYYIEPVDADDLLKMLVYLNDNQMPYYVMGNGSNVLISDEGIRGVVINLELGFGYLKHEQGYIYAGAGTKIARFVEFCIQHSYAGVEMLAGIPATIGGTLIMNAGCYGGEISTYVTEVTVIKNMQVKKLTREECKFVYRNSGLKDSVILEAKFRLPAGDVIELSERRSELMKHRNGSQPVEIPNAGCVFKNPKGNFAAKLIEECGLKGKALGGAMVSTKHANFIVNYDKATAEDVIELIRLIKTTVKEKTGYDLEMEIKLIGFDRLEFNHPVSSGSYR